MHERDVTLLAVRFTVMIVYSHFDLLEMDPFVGCMDSENNPHVIVCYVVFVFYLCTGKNICDCIFVELHLSDIHQGSGGDTMVCTSIQVDVNGLVYVLEIFHLRAVAKNMHRALFFKEDPVWVQASGVVLHVVRDLVKARTWRGIRVVFVLVIGLGVLFYLSVALIRFVFNVHTLYACCDAVKSLNDVVRDATLFLQYVLFVLLERA